MALRTLDISDGFASAGVPSDIALPLGASSSAKQDLLLAELQLKADLTDTQPVSVSSLPLPSGAATQVTLEALLTELQLKADLNETQPVSGSFYQATQPVSIASTVNVAAGSTSGTITAIQKTVGLTEVRATVSGSAPSASRKRLYLKPSKNNLGAVFIIPTGGSISTGLEIVGPDRVEFLGDASDYYLISDTAGQIVEILEVT